MSFLLALIVTLILLYLSRKESNVVLYATCALILILNIFSVIDGHSWGDDFIIYLAQAKALLHGGINDIIHKQQLIVHLSGVKHGPVLYPWGYPFFLSFVNYFFGDNFFAYKMISVAAILATCLGIGSFIKIDKKDIFILFLLIGINPFLFDYKNEINADMLFMCFTTWGMYFVKRSIDNWDTKFSWRDSIISGFIFFMCSFVKAAGVIVPVVYLASAVVVLVNNNRLLHKNIYKKLALVFTCYLVLIFITNKFLPGYFSDYVSYYNIKTIISASTANFINYIIDIKSFVNNRNVYLHFFSAAISAILFIAGVYSNFRRYYYIALLFIFTFCLVFITPYYGGARYLLPILPFYFLFCFLGAKFLYRNRSKPVSFIGLLSPLILALCFLSNDIQYLFKKNELHIKDGAFSKKANEFYNFIERETSVQDTLIFFKPRLLTFYANRISSVYYDSIPVPGEKFRYLTIYRNMNSNRKELERILPDYQKRKIFDNGDFQIYDLK
jgi:hypothetical protein